MSVWTSDDLRAFLDAISDHYLYPLYLLAAPTGMRRAELAGDFSPSLQPHIVCRDREGCFVAVGQQILVDRGSWHAVPTPA